MTINMSMKVTECEHFALLCKDFHKENEKKAAVCTFGCQQNIADSDMIRGLLVEMGYTLTENLSETDLIVFNSCAVREHAEKKILSKIGELVHEKARNNELVIVLCGCMTENETRRAEIKKSYPYVDILLGTRAVSSLPKAVYNVLTTRAHYVEVPEGTQEIFMTKGVRTLAETAHISVMYGCDNFCTYCIVPYTRGRERSREKEAVLKDISEAVREGAKDIVLLGQNVNSYNDKGVDFADLLKLANEIDGDYRIRFLTSHPKDATEKLFAAMRDCEHIAKALHLPMQSGSTRVLTQMNRRYSKEDYLALAKKLREYVPEVEITTDIIVGFPTESEEDFQETLAVFSEVKFDSAFTFVFSKRRGTKAFDMEGQIPYDIKKERMSRLLELARETAIYQNESVIGKEIEVLIKERRKGNIYYAKTASGKKVTVSCDDDITIPSYTKVTVTSAKAKELFAIKN